jgi:hypothetical protein
MALITTRPDEVSINLLPDDVRSTQKTQRWFQYAVAAAITIVVILAAVTVYFRMQIAHQQDILAEETAKAASLQQQVAALQEYADLKASVDSAKATLATALAGDINWTKFLDDLDSNMPSNSSLSSLSVTAAPGTTALGEPSFGTAQYAGAVTDMPGLAGWLDTMSEITGLRFVYLSNGSKGEGSVTFSATAHMTEEMLSGRCAKEGARCP